ncbi:hypothetical protein [Streptosporangium roseum]|uniref:hypothetical protein n=1 Tax=Streptosporangium roseum TaxID=2001 RepID=UPI0001A3D79F|nr:hypothetical protein [Streptosporangium roseum]
MDDVDALPHAEWSAVAAWLKAGKAVTTRRARLADVAAFVRWLAAEAPDVQLPAVTEDHLTHYRDTIATGTARAAAHPADAAAVALLSVCAVRVSELVSLTVGSVAIDAGHTVILFRRKGGKVDQAADHVTDSGQPGRRRRLVPV